MRVQGSAAFVVGVAGLVAAGDDGVTGCAVAFEEEEFNFAFDGFRGEGFAVVVEGVAADVRVADEGYGGVHCGFGVLLDFADVCDFSRGFDFPVGPIRAFWKFYFVAAFAQVVCRGYGKGAGDVEGCDIFFLQ